MYYMDGNRPLNNRLNNVVARAYGDVNGDKIPDHIYLVGNRTPDSPFIQDIRLVIIDGRTGMKQSSGLKSNAGYSPALFLGDFTGDGIDDILISIASGGSGGIMFYYIFSDAGNNLRMIFDYEQFNNQYNYKVKYLDGFKVLVENLKSGSRFIIDITYKGKEYLDEIYTPDGKLKEPIEGWVDPLSGLFPVDFDGNGVYELLGYQSIAGRYHADRLGYVQSVLKWNGREFYMEQQYVAIYGSNGD